MEQEETFMHSHRYHPPRMAGNWAPGDVVLFFLFLLLLVAALVAFNVPGR